MAVTAFSAKKLLKSRKVDQIDPLYAIAIDIIEKFNTGRKGVANKQLYSVYEDVNKS